jgi:hypothetical protein
MRNAVLLACSVVAAATLFSSGVGLAQSELERLRKRAGEVVDQLNPITQARRGLDLAAALASNDLNGARQAVGGIFLNSPSCLACPQLAREVAPNLSTEQIERVVGTGVLAFVGTSGDPTLVILAVGAAYAKEVQLSRQPGGTAPMPAGAPAPQPRQERGFTTTATCIIRREGTVWAGYSQIPMLNPGSGAPTQLFLTDIRRGDALSGIHPARHIALLHTYPL